MPPSILWKQWALGLTGLLGAVIFGFFFMLTWHTPQWVERFAAQYIERQVEKQVDARIDAISLPSGNNGSGALARMAGAIHASNEAEIARHKESLRSLAHERMADAIAEIRNLDCECRDRWAQWLEQGSRQHIQLLRNANAAITEFIQSSYANVVNGLKNDIRIFTLSNAAMYGLLLLTVLLKPRAMLQLFIPGVLLALATLVCSYFYVFEQNWLLTIIHNDYLGLGYLAYLALVFGFLCDIALNRARICTNILNGIFDAVGSALTAVPC